MRREEPDSVQETVISALGSVFTRRHGLGSARTLTAEGGDRLLVPMPTADCRLLHHGRIMRCLTYLLLLPETLKKSKKVGKLPGKLPVCYEILTLSLTSKKKKQEEQEEQEKMAAELYPAANTNNTNLSNGTTVADTEKTKEVQVSQAGGSSAATTPTTQHNINNNNPDPPSWQCSHPTLRER